MKYLFIWVCCLFVTTVYSQETFKFNVIKTVSRLKNQKGDWNDWKEIGEMNEKMKQKIIFNLEGKWLQWITQFEDDAPTLHMYKILDINADNTYKDFGIWVLKIDAQQGNTEPQVFKILFIEGTTGTSYMMITGSDVLQSKYALKHEE